MALDRARDHLELHGLADRLIVLERSSATVAEAAEAVGTEPERIAKTLSFLVDGAPVLVVAAGDARIDNAAFKREFGCKPRMLAADDVERLVGHAIGGVCPFGVEPGVSVYLDESLRRFDMVYPAGGTSNSAVRLSLAELERSAGHPTWVSVTTVRSTE